MRLQESERNENERNDITKKTKAEKLKKFLDEVQAERKQVDDNEKEFITSDNHQTHFPYTHGDSLEMAREK